MFKILIRFLLIYLLFLTGIFAQDAEQKFVPLPVTSKTITLRSLVINNERLPLLEANRVKQILLNTQVLVHQHLGVNVVFVEPKFSNIKIAKLLIRKDDQDWIKDQSLDLSSHSDVIRLKKAMRIDLKLGGENIEDLINYVKPYLLKPLVENSEVALADALSETQVSLMNRWGVQSLQDGSTLLGNDLFNQYHFWTTLGFANLPFEIVLTNQLIASAEVSENSVHSALRGGVSNGITGTSAFSKHGAFSVLSVYPFYSADATTVELRKGKKYSEDEAAKYAAALLAHELGHQLLHLGHPFNNPSCIMRPPQRLEFDSWYKNLDASKCNLNSSDAMTPGKTVKYSDIRKK